MTFTDHIHEHCNCDHRNRIRRVIGSLGDFLCIWHCATRAWALSRFGILGFNSGVNFEAREEARRALSDMMAVLDRPIDQKIANGSRPKSKVKARNQAQDLIFLLDAHCLCIENNITSKTTAPIPNWRCMGTAAHFHWK